MLNILYKIMTRLEVIESELDNISIDNAKNELYCLKDDLERMILDLQKDEDILYNRSPK